MSWFRPLLAVLLLSAPASHALDKCSHTFSFLGAAEGTAPCFWVGEQTTGSCASFRLKEGFRLHQIWVQGSKPKVLTTRLRNDYPDWLGLESWLAKSGTLKAHLFESKGGEWALDLDGERLRLTPPRGSGPPGVAGRKTLLLRRVPAGPGGEFIDKAWWIPQGGYLFIRTRAAGPENATLEGYTLLKIRGAR